MSPLAKIRPMLEDDLSGVMPIEIASFEDAWTPLAFALELRHNPCARYVVAVGEDGAIAGYAGYWNTPRGAAILKIATAPQARSAGIGSALLESVLEAARREGLRAARLDVRASNAVAQAFYRKHGFQREGTQPMYYGDEDAVIMARKL